jgi:hypothetical protein
MSKIITGLFDSYSDAKDAVDTLETAGVPRGDISIVANETHGREDVGRRIGDDAGRGVGLGAIAGGTTGLLAGLGLLVIPGIGPVLASGWLAATSLGVLGGAAVGGVAGAAAGGIVGALTRAGVPDDDANIYAEGVRRGGTLVSARVSDAQIPATRSALSGGHAISIERRREAYRGDGWSRFDHDAPPYTAAQIRADRDRHARV